MGADPTQVLPNAAGCLLLICTLTGFTRVFPDDFFIFDFSCILKQIDIGKEMVQ